MTDFIPRRGREGGERDREEVWDDDSFGAEPVEFVALTGNRRFVVLLPSLWIVLLENLWMCWTHQQTQTNQSTPKSLVTATNSSKATLPIINTFDLKCRWRQFAFTYYHSVAFLWCETIEREMENAKTSTINFTPKTKGLWICGWLFDIFSLFCFRRRWY
jgi:hypothetical protein